MNILAIVPARVGSKRLKDKNILSLCGKPVIAHTLIKATNSKLITKTVVSTDGEKIADIAKEYCEVIMRPKELAANTSSIYDVIEHVIDVLKKKNETYDIVALLEPTSPLRKDNDIDNAIKLFIKNIEKADALVSVGEVAVEKPNITKYISKNGFIKPITNNLEKAYFPYCVIYMAKTDSLLKKRTFYQEKTIPYIIERWQNYEIDDKYDFVAIEAILNYQIKVEK